MWADLTLFTIFNFVTQHLPGLVMVGAASFVLFLYLQDKYFVRDHAVRKNYPLLGRLRYAMEHLSTFTRQYFANDRSEEPFNRAQRSWAYRAAKGISTYESFGSTRDHSDQDYVFRNRHFGPLAPAKGPVVIGANNPHVQRPYTAKRPVNISGMSYGALGSNAVTALAEGAHLSEAYINTGEGGPSSYHIDSRADLCVQLGTAYYGFRDEEGNLDFDKLERRFQAHSNFRMLQIKLAQSAKPGLGGHLPGHKVTPEIAEERGIPVGQDSISPPRHAGIESFEDLFNFITRLRARVNVPIGIKLCVGDKQEIRDLFAALDQYTHQGQDLQGVFDFINVDAEGGTGSAPLALIDAAGLPLKNALPCVVEALDVYPHLREHITIIASGKRVNPREQAFALAVGADLIETARGAMFALGCIQAQHCARGDCPTGIATTDPKLQRGLDPSLKKVRVANYLHQCEKEINQIAQTCGAEDWTGLDADSIVRIRSKDGNI